MLTSYIKNAMAAAHYELMEDGRYFGSISKCKGLCAEAKSLDECRSNLQATLEDWILLGLQLGHRLPVLGGVSLNRKKFPHAQAR